MRSLFVIGSVLVILALAAAALQAAAQLAILLFAIGAMVLLVAVVMQDFRRNRPPE